MFTYLRRLYLSSKLTDAGLANAVGFKWITEEQAEQLRLEKNPPAPTPEPTPEPEPEPTKED